LRRATTPFEGRFGIAQLQRPASRAAPFVTMRQRLL